MDRQQLQSYHCPRWQELPSLGLYMDQVLQVLSEVTAPLRPEGEPACTATMVNNYVKLKVLAPSEKKKYNQSHLATLILITMLKTILSMQEIRRFLALITAEVPLNEAYDRFAQTLEQLLSTLGKPQERPASTDLITVAVYAYVSKLGIQLLLSE
jgi:hypothetical protein